MGSSSAFIVIVVVAVALLDASSGVAGACDTGKFIDMLDCLPAAVGTGGVTASCCNKGLAYKSDPQCLCDTLVYAKTRIPAINIKKALAIPKACGFSKYVPPGFKCQGLTVPT